MTIHKTYFSVGGGGDFVVKHRENSELNRGQTH